MYRNDEPPRDEEPGENCAMCNKPVEDDEAFCSEACEKQYAKEAKEEANALFADLMVTGSLIKVANEMCPKCRGKGSKKLCPHLNDVSDPGGTREKS